MEYDAALKRRTPPPGHPKGEVTMALAYTV